MGSGISVLLHDQLERVIARGGKHVLIHRHTFIEDLIIHNQPDSARLTPSLGPFDPFSDLRQVDALAEVPAKAIRAADQWMQKSIEGLVYAGLYRRRSVGLDGRDLGLDPDR